MGKKDKIIDREIAPDVRYNSVALSKFINYLMERGKKSVARRVVYDALDIVAEERKRSAFDFRICN